MPEQKPPMPRKTYRMDRDGEAILTLLANAYGLSKAAAVRMAVRFYANYLGVWQGKPDEYDPLHPSHRPLRMRRRKRPPIPTEVAN